MTRTAFDRELARGGEALGQTLHELWNFRDDPAWSRDPHFLSRLGERASSTGQLMFAHDILKEGHARFPLDLRLSQLYALSLVRCGFLLPARDLLENLVKKGHRDEETVGILGRVYKDMWGIEGGGDRRHPYLLSSRDLYMKAFRRSRGHYSGINAASLCMIAGEERRARLLAAQVRDICTERQVEGRRPDYWLSATLGEAFALLGDFKRAEAEYRAARAASDKNYAEVASSRRQLSLLSRFMDVPQELLAVLRVPPVVAFTGHMIDAPDRPSPQFPRAGQAKVKRAVAAALDELGAGIGYASAASGGDLIFLECMQERGAETTIVLPFERTDFCATSVDFAGAGWRRRFERALGRCTELQMATRGTYRGDELLFDYANRIIAGEAMLRASLLETQAHLLAVWNGRDGGKPGGTASAVRAWRSLGLPLTVVDPLNGSVDSGGGRGAEAPIALRSRSSTAAGGGRRPKGGPPARRLAAFLFSDLVGFSRLTDEQVPGYVEGFLGKVARIVKRSARGPISVNTWGDATFMVFDDALAAATCALGLRDLVRSTDWRAFGLPADLSIRIGLHAGPAYALREPLLDRLNFFGAHVNQAARIEPVTSPGNVYASEQFAALLVSDPGNRLECRYVGIVTLPKKFGSYPIYHLKRKGELG